MSGRRAWGIGGMSLGLALLAAGCAGAPHVSLGRRGLRVDLLERRCLTEGQVHRCERPPWEARSGDEGARDGQDLAPTGS